MVSGEAKLSCRLSMVNRVSTDTSGCRVGRPVDVVTTAFCSIHSPAFRAAAGASIRRMNRSFSSKIMIMTSSSLPSALRTERA